MTPALVLALTITATPGLIQFTMRVNDYVETHRRVAATIEQPLCSDAEELTRQADALAAAIRDARPRAKDGDIFTFAVSEVLHRRTGPGKALFSSCHLFGGFVKKVGHAQVASGHVELRVERQGFLETSGGVFVETE